MLLLLKHLVFIHTDVRPVWSSPDLGLRRWLMHTDFDSLYSVSASCVARLWSQTSSWTSSFCLSLVGAQLTSQHLSILQPFPPSWLFPRTYPGLSGAIFRSHLFLVLEAPGRMNFRPTLLWVTRLSKDSEEREQFPGLTLARNHWLCEKTGTLFCDPAGVCYCWALQRLIIQSEFDPVLSGEKTAEPLSAGCLLCCLGLPAFLRNPL